MLLFPTALAWTTRPSERVAPRRTFDFSAFWQKTAILTSTSLRDGGVDEQEAGRTSRCDIDESERRGSCPRGDWDNFTWCGVSAFGEESEWRMYSGMISFGTTYGRGEDGSSRLLARTRACVLQPIERLLVTTKWAFEQIDGVHSLFPVAAAVFSLLTRLQLKGGPRDRLLVPLRQRLPSNHNHTSTGYTLPLLYRSLMIHLLQTPHPKITIFNKKIASSKKNTSCTKRDQPRRRWSPASELIRERRVLKQRRYRQCFPHLLLLHTWPTTKRRVKQGKLHQIKVRRRQLTRMPFSTSRSS